MPDDIDSDDRPRSPLVGTDALSEESWEPEIFYSVYRQGSEEVNALLKNDWVTVNNLPTGVPLLLVGRENIEIQENLDFNPDRPENQRPTVADFADLHDDRIRIQAMTVYEGKWKPEELIAGGKEPFELARSEGDIVCHYHWTGIDILTGSQIGSDVIQLDTDTEKELIERIKEVG